MANIGINISENGTTTLATAGKYCDRNIDVVVEVAGAGGGDLPEEVFLITGNCSSRFRNNGWNWFIELYGDKIVAENISNATFMFAYSDKLKEVPFDIEFEDVVSGQAVDKTNLFTDCKNLEKVGNLVLNNGACGSLFSNCNNLKEIGSLINLESRSNNSFNGMFNGCHNLRHLPALENKGELVNNSNLTGFFADCYSLRNIPNDWNELLSVNHSYGGYAFYSGSCKNNYALDEIKNLHVNYYSDTAAFTSNSFNNIVSQCLRLKDFTFEVNKDGSAKVARWKAQTINFTDGVGWCPTTDYSRITGYNSGITADKLVTDDATYQALKNDTDWFTTNRDYARYNHDSAVRTINSLPDTSAYLATQSSGVNTIQFTGAQGSSTDGGAINTLTDAEIAVAAAKGWTVSFA